MPSSEPLGKISVIDSRKGCPTIDIVPNNGGHAISVIGPVNGALHRTIQIIELNPDAITLVLDHPSDSVYYVTKGTGFVEDIASGTATSIVEGSMIHIDAGDRYRFRAGPDGVALLGGPCPADPRWYDQARFGQS